MPDLIIVDSKFIKHLMIDNGIPEGRIFVGGSPKLDDIYKRKQNYGPQEKTSFFSRMGIGHNKKLIVWAGTHVCNEIGLHREEYRKLVFSFCTALKDIEKVQLLIKLHPYEFDFKFYRDIVRETGIDNPIIVKDIDRWELLFASDLLATLFSMMSYEAVILDKPVICFQEFDKYLPGILIDDVWDLKDCEAVVCVNEVTKSIINDLLFNPIVKDNLRKNRQKYILSHTDYLGFSLGKVKNLLGRVGCNV